MSKTQAGRRWYEAFAESDAPVGWTAWKDLDTPSKARYARAEKAYLAKLLDAEGKVVVTQEAAAAIGSAKRKSTVLKAEDINTFTDAETELEAIKQFLDGIAPGEGTILERVMGVRNDGNQALADERGWRNRAEEKLLELAKLTNEQQLEWAKERHHLMREAVRNESECATQEERANVLEAVILKAMRGEKA